MEETVVAARLTAARLTAERVVATGTVKGFDGATNEGTISPDEGDGDLLVRLAGAADGAPALVEGMRVRFAVDEGDRGLEAFDVVPIVSTPPVVHGAPGRGWRPDEPAGRSRRSRRRVPRRY